MTVVESPLSTLPRDVAALLARYRETIMPVARGYLDAKVSGNELRTCWKPYYFGAFHRYDLTVERAWREATGTDGGIEAGSPLADPTYEMPLKHFPVSVAHNNLDRLVEVLAIELGDRTVEAAQIRERTTDFAHIVEGLESLMESLAG
jgi:hypothetical protein